MITVAEREVMISLLLLADWKNHDIYNVTGFDKSSCRVVSRNSAFKGVYNSTDSYTDCIRRTKIGYVQNTRPPHGQTRELWKRIESSLITTVYQPTVQQWSGKPMWQWVHRVAARRPSEPTFWPAVPGDWVQSAGCQHPRRRTDRRTASGKEAQRWRHNQNCLPMNWRCRKVVVLPDQPVLPWGALGRFLGRSVSPW